MAITTIYSHINRAIEFFLREDIYFAIAKPTVWPDEVNPPVPAFDTYQLDEPIGYKKAESVFLVVPDDLGEIEYRDSKWKQVAPEDAMTLGAKWVYISTSIKYDELPLADYRQIGVFTGLQAQSYVEPGKYNLIPDDVAHEGTLEIVDNRRVTIRDMYQKEVLSMIIEF